MKFRLRKIFFTCLKLLQNLTNFYLYFFFKSKQCVALFIYKIFIYFKKIYDKFHVIYPIKKKSSDVRPYLLLFYVKG